MRDSEKVKLSIIGGVIMSHKRRLSAEEIVRIVREYKTGKASAASLAQRCGINIDTVYRWSKAYDAEGTEAFVAHERNRVYGVEEKLEAVHAYLANEGSLQTIAQKYHLRSPKQLQDWLKVYNAHGDFNSVKFSGGGSYMKQGRETTQQERMEIVKECIAGGKNYGAMALKYKVSYQQIRNWTLRYEEKGEAGLEDRRGRRKKDQTPRTELEKAQIEIEQLKHKLYLAEMENSLLKKLEEIERRDAFRK